MIRSILTFMMRRLAAKARSRRMAALDIGEGTRVDPDSIDSLFPELVHIGANCIIAPASMILTHDASFYLCSGEYRVAPVFIGDNVFVGYGAIIMPGVTIGRDAIIGAGSVVTKDVPSGCVVAGVPARELGSVHDSLMKRRSEEMYKPHYAGKAPNETNEADVATFCERVMASIQGHCD